MKSFPALAIGMDFKPQNGHQQEVRREMARVWRYQDKAAESLVSEHVGWQLGVGRNSRHSLRGPAAWHCGFAGMTVNRFFHRIAYVRCFNAQRTTGSRASLRICSISGCCKAPRHPCRPRALGLRYRYGRKADAGAPDAPACANGFQPQSVTCGAVLSADMAGVNPPSVKDRDHATSAASSPIFRALKTSLVQTGCPSAPVVLDRLPLTIRAFAPFHRKTLFAFRVRGDLPRRSGTNLR